MGDPRCSTAPVAPSTSSCAARHTRSRCGGSGRTGSGWRSLPAPTEQTVDADLDRLDEYTSRITIAGRTHRLITATHGPVQLVEVDGVTHRVSRDEGGVLRSPAPALVVATPVAVGAEVAAGAPVLVLESMKMETVLPAPFAGRVKELLVSAGSQVETGTPLVRLEPVGDGDEAAADGVADEPVDLDLPEGARPVTAPPRRPTTPAPRSRPCCSATTSTSATRAAPSTSYLAARDELTAQGASQIRAEIDVLEVFADFAELSRNRPAGEEAHVEHRVHSPREHFHTYLQSLDPDRGALPEQFRSKLANVLRHYGLDSLDRTAELEQAVFRVFLSQQRSAPDVALATSLLQRWMVEPCPEAPLDAAAREVLDRLVVATQLRFPVVGDLARSVRFRWFDQPLVDADRASVLGGVSDELDRAGGDAGWRGPRRAASTRWPPSPSRSCSSSPSGSKAASRSASRCSRSSSSGTTASTTSPACASSQSTAGPSRWPTTRSTGAPPTWSRSVGRVDELVPDGELEPAVAAQLDETAGGRRGRRRPLPVLARRARVTRGRLRRASASSSPRMPFAQRRAPGRRRRLPRRRSPGRPTSPSVPTVDGAMVEDRLVRGVHPMVGRRLNLWRLRDFDVTRLDAPEDVLLYLCTAPGNEADQRLVALAQVRQLVVVRDEQGQVTALPHAERAIANCLEAIRRARAARGAAGAKLDMNHVWVHIWPPVEADLDQLTALQAKIAPLTAGAGIEEVLVQGRIAAPGRRQRAARRAVPLPARLGCRHLRRGAADRAAEAARRLRAEGRPGAASRRRLPLRAAGDDRRPRRHGHRVRPRRHRRARPGRPSLRPQQGRDHRRASSRRPPSATPRA